MPKDVAHKSDAKVSGKSRALTVLKRIISHYPIGLSRQFIFAYIRLLDSLHAWLLQKARILSVTEGNRLAMQPMWDNDHSSQIWVSYSLRGGTLLDTLVHHSTTWHKSQ